MKDIRPSTDVLPVTEFRANTSELLARARSTKRPMILTQHGRGTAVLMDVEVYEELLDEIAMLRDINTAEEQEARGEAIPNDEAVARLRSRLVK
jgi:antitoxin YefM